MCYLLTRPGVVPAPSYVYTALGSDGQGPKGFSFGFLELSIYFFDLFADLARMLGSLGASVEVARGRASTYGYVWIAQSHAERPR